MPIYATATDMETLYGVDEIVVASDRDGDHVADVTTVDEALAAASRRIEAYGGRYGLVPTDVAANDPATPGTFPGWWKDACRDMALDIAGFDPGATTERKHKKYDEWISFLESEYPARKPSGGVQLEAGERRFTRDTMVGVL